MEITYLFGAGASKEALPIVNEMVSSMAHQMQSIKRLHDGLTDTQIIIPISSCVEEYLSDLTWLVNLVSKHSSVDTLAKKMFITDDKNYEKYKNCLATFFMIEQLKNGIDKRYDSFLASLLDSVTNLPDNIKIISWNYDMQFELAYYYFTNSDNLFNAQQRVKVFSKHQDNYFADGKFGIYKLNGSSIVYKNDNSKRTNHYFTGMDCNFSLNNVIEICTNYCKFNTHQKNYFSGLSFSWENENYVIGSRETILDLAKAHTENTDILVLIGYSIPFFNRQVDRALIKNMKNLSKVYVQAPDAPGIIERFYSIRDDISSNSIIPIRDCSQFYLPNEL